MSNVHIVLGGPGQRSLDLIVVDGQDITGEVTGFTLTAEARPGIPPRLELDLRVHDVTTFEAPHVQVLINPTTAAYLERAGWTPPPGERSVLTRRADDCPCEQIEICESPDGLMVDQKQPAAERKTILGRTVPTCPVHGINARRADGRG